MSSSWSYLDPVVLPLLVGETVHRHVWKQTLPSPLSGEWDTVLAIELVEHIGQEQVDEVLDILEQAARRRVVVSTPNSLLLRPGSETPVGFNPYEAHLSHAPRRLFAQRGYRVRGVGFGRYDSRLARTAKRVGIRNSLTTLPRRLPAIAETIVAIKDLD